MFRFRSNLQQSDTDDEDSQPTDEQTEIAKHLRFNCETKSSSYQSQKVTYFKGSVVTSNNF